MVAVCKTSLPKARLSAGLEYLYILFAKMKARMVLVASQMPCGSALLFLSMKRPLTGQWELQKIVLLLFLL